MPSLEQHEDLKKKVLVYVLKRPVPVTPYEVSENLGIVYSTALSCLMELVLEGHLEYYRRGWVRWFRPKQEGDLRVIER